MKSCMIEKPYLSGEKGFTLIEILIAISIFAIGMLAIASMQISGIQGNATAFTLSGGTNWASDKAEQLLARAYSHPDLTNGNHGPETDDTGRYTIRWTVTDDAPVNNVKTIVIQVDWTDRGNAKSMVLNYYRADI